MFGFAMNSIYGFGQMLLPGLLRIGSTRRWAIELAHWLHNAGVIIVCLATGLVADGLGMVIGSGLLVGGAVMFAVGHHGFVGRRRTSFGAEKGHAALDLYPPLAFLWLLAALALMTGGALYESMMAGQLPHAYTGAVRHALIVGFMTTLIRIHPVNRIYSATGSAAMMGRREFPSRRRDHGGDVTRGGGLGRPDR